jgi:hypothetical protein
MAKTEINLDLGGMHEQVKNLERLETHQEKAAK